MMGFKLFPVDPIIPYGPSDWAKALFIEELPDGHPQKHYHHTTVDICVSGVACGKTVNATGRGIYLLRKYRSKGIVGAVNYPLLERAVMDEGWARIFGDVNGADGPWKHHEVKKRPNYNRKILSHINGGLVYFMNLSRPELLKSIAADWLIIEEAPTIKGGSQFYYELLGRMRSPMSPIHQVILLANPQLKGNWMYDTFGLKQFMPSYNGEPIPMGKPCECQYCPICLRRDKEKVEWVNNECPICGIKNDRERQVYHCVNCKAHYNKKPVLVKYDGEYCPKCGWRRCPGNQQFHRFLSPKLAENQFVDERFVGDMKATMSATQFRMLGQGEILETNTGTIHTSWSDIENILPTDVPMEYGREMYWCQDFNTDPMTTVLLQCYWDGSIKNWVCVDEIITLRSTVQDSVKYFIERYGDYRGKVRIYGDPSGFAGKIKGKVIDRYEQICISLGDAGVDFELMATSTPFSISSRLDTFNWQLSDAAGYTKLRFNPKCVFSIESARGITWSERSNEETKKHDFYIRDLALAAELPPGLMDPKVCPVVPLSHPQAAIGYMLMREDPQIVYADPVTWHMDSRGVVIESQDGEMTERTFSSSKINLLNMEATEEEIKHLLGKGHKEESLGSSLRDQGLWFR